MFSVSSRQLLLLTLCAVKQYRAQPRMTSKYLSHRRSLSRKLALRLPKVTTIDVHSALSPLSSPPAPRRMVKRVVQANKACVPCRARKIKCDAAVVGVPCSSCTSRQSSARECVLSDRKRRTRFAWPNTSYVNKCVLTSMRVSAGREKTFYWLKVM